jgi:hypothetical protein
MEDFFAGDEPYHPIPRDWNYEQALIATADHFRPNRKLHPVSFPDLRYYPWPLSVSAEVPWTNENFSFVPMFRDLDLETTKARLMEQDNREEREMRWNALKHEIRRSPYGDGAVPVLHYLRLKQKHGLIPDSKTTFHNLYNEIFQYNRGRVHQVKDGDEPFWTSDGKPKPYYWNVLHARSHVVAKDEPDKIRAVFGASKLLLMMELMFIWPLQATYLNSDAGRLLWGREMSKGGWKRLFSEIHARKAPNTVMGADWSKFDKRLLHELIDDVHTIWRDYFDFRFYEPTFHYPHGMPQEQRINNLWTWMCHAIRRTPILLPNQSVWEWVWNGFGSGYQQTQLMDSFANTIMNYTCLLALGINIFAKEFWSRFQGDDSLIAFQERMFMLYGNNFLDMVAASALFYFNAILNVKKSIVQDRVTGMTVLSYSNKFGICSRSEEDLLRHLFFPERARDYAKLAASAVGLAIASMGEHDRFHRLCEKIFKHITEEFHLEPNWKALAWMVRAHMVEDIKDLKFGKFPDQLRLQAKAFIYEPRGFREMEKQWPTTPQIEGDFHFLKAI